MRRSQQGTIATASSHIKATFASSIQWHVLLVVACVLAMATAYSHRTSSTVAVTTAGLVLGRYKAYNYYRHMSKQCSTVKHGQPIINQFFI